NHVYVRMTRPDDGAIVRGEYMQSLPPSVLSVLGGSEQGTSVIPLRTAAVWDFDLSTDYAVSGSRLLTLTVERLEDPSPDLIARFDAPSFRRPACRGLPGRPRRRAGRAAPVLAA